MYNKVSIDIVYIEVYVEFTYNGELRIPYLFIKYTKDSKCLVLSINKTNMQVHVYEQRL